VSTSTSTIVFTDVVGSTALRTRIGEDAADRLLREHERALAEVVCAWSGRVVKTAGDGIMAAFESATDAVRASIALQQRIDQDFPDLSVRVSVATGDVSWEDDDCFGMPVVTAARLQAHADGRQIVVSALVRGLGGERSQAVFEPLGPLMLAGISEAVEAFEVQWSPLQEQPAQPKFTVSLPSALGVAPTFDLVGRSTEWSELMAGWETASTGSRRTVLIGGEAGAGKTRLAFEFGRWCAERGSPVVLGVCDAELALPCQPWVHVLDQLAHAIPPDLVADVRDDIAPMSVLVPHLEFLTAVSRPAASEDPDTERYRLFQAVDVFLRVLTEERTMVVIVDDLHWADAQTLALLRHLARGNGPAKLLIIGTFRDTGDEITDPLAGCLADLRRVDSATRLRVVGLDPSSVSQLVTGAVGHELDGRLQSLAGVLAERSGGNAFYLSELWRHLVSNTIVACIDGRWEVRGDVSALSGVPDSVREVVTHRLAQLSPRARWLLEVAAVAGRRVEFGILVHATARTPDEIDATLDELLHADLLLELAGTAAPSYEFVHDIVREAVERTVSSATRARLHRDLGNAVEFVYAADDRPVLADLARHFVAAGRLGTADKALAYSRRAASQALRSGVFDAAVAHLDAAYAFAAAGSEEAIDILLELGEVRSRMGDDAHAADDFVSAFEMARVAGNVEQAAKAALGFGESQTLWGVDCEPTVKIASAALVLSIDTSSPSHIRLKACLARALSLIDERHDEAGVLFDEAVDAARAIGDDELLLFCLACRNHNFRSLPHAYLTSTSTCCELALRLGNYWRYCYVLQGSMRVLLQLGRVGESAAAARDLARVAQRERFALFSLYVANHEVLLSLIAGRFDDAERLASDNYTRALEIGHDSATGLYGLQMYAIRREQGRLDEVAGVLRAAARLGSGEPVWRPGLAALFAELGMLEDAGREFAALAPHNFAVIPRDSMWPCCLAFLAEVCMTLGTREHAAALYRELEPFAGATLMAAFTLNCGPTERFMGGLAALLGDVVLAEQHFRAALQLADESGSPVWQARVQADWSLAVSGHDDLRAAAHATAITLGMRTLAERTKPHPSAARRKQLP